MLHHSNSRNPRNRGSRLKTLLQATLLLGVVIWLLYQVKHSYDRKNEYLDDTEDQLAHNDRTMFQGRKEKAGSYGDSNMELAGENSNVITKPEEGAVDHQSDIFDHIEEKNGEIVFEKDNADLHEGDKRNTESSGAEEGQANSVDDETVDHSEEAKHDAESNSDAEDKSDVHSTGDEVPQNNQAQEENTSETSRTSHDEVVQGDGSANADQTNASGSESDGEEGEKKEAVDTQTGSDDVKAETNEDHAAGSLPDETGNVPSVHTDNSQNDATENQGDTALTTFDSSEHDISEAIHIENGLGDGSATASSGTASGVDKGNSVESNSSDNTSAEEQTGAASGEGEKGAETGAATEGSYFKEENSEDSSAKTVQAANTEAENSRGDSSGGSSEEAKSGDNMRDGASEMSNNGVQSDTKLETSTSTNDDERNESQGGTDGGSGSNNSNGSGPEQTGKTESQ